LITGWRAPTGNGLVALLNGGEYSIAELSDMFGVARSTVCRTAEPERAHNVMGVGSMVG